MQLTRILEKRGGYAPEQIRIANAIDREISEFNRPRKHGGKREGENLAQIREGLEKRGIIISKWTILEIIKMMHRDHYIEEIGGKHYSMSPYENEPQETLRRRTNY